MEQLTYVGAGHIEWREVPEPQLQGDREALVRPIAVTTCDLDFAIVRGLVPFPAPFALGHESVGEVNNWCGSRHGAAWGPGRRAVSDFLRSVLILHSRLDG